MRVECNAGRTRGTGGFTMIELVIGIAVLAILGGVAVSGYGWMRNAAAERAMINDLTALAPAMEKHFNDHNGYPTAIVTSGAPSATTIVFQTSPDVTLAFSGAPTATGYTATAVHSKRNGWRCELTIRDFGASAPLCAAV